ncbi:hypothetical protein [Chitinimonas lacunae]|uniref:Uncharacterized protein n=1 Tax=Chitinimonas lacunae TaxID=1963018 RepID=A0ABV8MLF8_9NEIS
MEQSKGDKQKLTICRPNKVHGKWDPLAWGTGPWPHKSGDTYEVTVDKGIEKLQHGNTYYLYQGSHDEQGQRAVCKKIHLESKKVEFKAE